MCKLNIIKNLVALPEQVEFLCRLGQTTFPNFMFISCSPRLKLIACFFIFLCELKTLKQEMIPLQKNVISEKLCSGEGMILCWRMRYV